MVEQKITGNETTKHSTEFQMTYCLNNNVQVENSMYKFTCF